MRWLLGLVLSVLLFAQGARAQDDLYDRPVLALETGRHLAPIRSADVDAAGRTAVTGSPDRTVRVWSLADGRLERTIRMPVGPGDIGKVYAVAISPDGGTIAAGGWMRATESDPQDQIYLFDRTSGRMTGRLGELPDGANHIAFSPDGRRLAAVLGYGGLRVYDRGDDGAWHPAWQDADYGDTSYGLAFGPEGRIATTSYDGKLRLYAAGGRLLSTVATDLPKPIDLAFNPVDGRLVVGFAGSPALRLHDGATLAMLPAPDTAGIDTGDLGKVAWSSDGATLYAAGHYQNEDGVPVLAWSRDGGGPHQVLAADISTVMSLAPLPDGALFVVAADPWLGVIGADGAARWSLAPATINPRGQRSNLAVSDDGMAVEFGLREWGDNDRRRFDHAALKLLPPAQDNRLRPPRQEGLDIADWMDSLTPTLAGTPLPLDPHEPSRSLAIHPDGGRFVLGAEWSLRAFDAAGAELWRRDVPGPAWAVNISGDGRFVVAAYGDGTIRWHRMEDGVELLALFPFADGEDWMVWEPEGRYASTLGARKALRWVVNRGWDTAPDELGADRIRDSFVPDVIRRVLPLGGTMEAVHAADQARRLADIRKLTGGPVPGAQLHVLAVGISDYGAQATRLKLDWADDDAANIATALAGQSDWPWRRGLQVALRNEEATDVAILDQLDAIRRRMALAPEGNDIAVIVFSGHGVVVGEGPTEEFYLLPHGADVATPARIRRSGLSGADLQAQIAALAGVGRVLLLLDACSSGATSGDGSRLGAPTGVLQSLARRNVTVLASSDATEISREDPEWGNGAFTEVVLEALGPQGDGDGNGMVSVAELADYVSRRLPDLTRGAQTPSIETRFQGDLFASGM
ncbi:MAG TPA: caspase family protein [Paracoccus sp. (in: a-proteobacteria)]|nr:caspase family protein [Paracoccus sp. (in: a-proteobacteria)]